MNILAIGDVVGDTGIKMLADNLCDLKKEHNIDFCIVNGENSCSHNGISRRSAEAIFDAGADVITLGNHTFRQKDAASLLHNEKRIIRPANYPPKTVGRGFFETTVCGKKIVVINLLGRIYLDYTDCPFQTAEKILNEIKADIIMVDFHAEATSEKASLAYFLDGRVTALFGTHTHVLTADSKLLPKGTGFITDIGMTGPYHSCLGVKKEITIERFTSCIPQRFEFADGAAQLSGAVFCIDDETNKTTDIKIINITPQNR